MKLIKRFGLALIALAVTAPLLGGCYVESGYGYYHHPHYYYRRVYPRHVHRVVVIGQNGQPQDPSAAAGDAPEESGTL